MFITDAAVTQALAAAQATAAAQSSIAAQNNFTTNPYQLNASDNPGSLISSVILKEDNYSEWAIELQNSLQAKQKLGFIDASTLWKSLQARFFIGNGVCKQVLKDEIALCKQNGQSVLEYYGRLTKLWKELQNYRTTQVCRCEAASAIAKEREEDQVHQFLFGLDLPCFSQLRSTITGEDPLPSLNQVYSCTIREEQNLNIARANETPKPDAIGFDAKGDSSARVAAVSGSRFRDRSTLTCTHCNRQGHEVSKCFNLHGYPDWYYELNKGSTQPSRSDPKDSAGRGAVQRGGRPPATRGRGRGRANNARVVPDQSQDEIAHLISLLQAQRPNTTSEKLSDVIDILPSAVKFPDGTGSRATKRGTLALSSDYLLPDVLFVPDFDCTLISKSKLLKQTGCIAIFTDTLCILQDCFTRTLIGAGEEREGVYYFTGVLACHVNKVSKDVGSSGALWHRRLGHPSASVLISLPNCDRSLSVLEEIKSCDICFRATQTREIFNDSINKASDCFSLVHCDVWGPYRTPSSCGAVYFLTLVDDFSRSVWTFLMSEKSEVAKLIRILVPWLKNNLANP
ncbi:unnamed protein product [Microthlaspi erraticum]|uniref:GAG-pre-integrase domain-containing protein n=1 Tax=Microthlaspi erraticum TaxID=1685480 RepID=A0A6D2L4Z0_9BRAS|nr:unnamed protein product [Microthlaspi erraticum]